MYNITKFISYIFFIIVIGTLLALPPQNNTLIYFIKIFIGGCGIIISGFWSVYYLNKMLK